MCGIAAYLGKGDVVRQAVDCLHRLEYRGYDSAGIAYALPGELRIQRCRGKVSELAARLRNGAGALAAISHTRWATHGPPTEQNAHPHTDCTGRLAVVHNGIIENHVQLRRELEQRGHRFRSETDTEVVAHLLEEELLGVRQAEDLVQALRRTVQRLEGSYALAVLHADFPGTVLAARHESPLLIGRGRRGLFVASDVPALIGCAEEMTVLENGDIAMLRHEEVTIHDVHGAVPSRKWHPVPADKGAAQKGGYAHFMLKEIHEEPAAVVETMRGRVRTDGRVELNEVPDDVMHLLRSGKVHFVACGTAYHAGLYGQRLFRSLLRRPAEAWVASEFRYDDPLVDGDSVVVLISQSGETADTLAAAREAKRRGARTLAIVNCAGSSLAREADAVILTHAGPEIGVASTKAYTAQVVALAALAASVAGDGVGLGLHRVPGAIAEALNREEMVREAAKALHPSSCFFFLGRGFDAAVAAEAALKLKEISYIHAEAYPAGEMKHGPLALIEPGVAVVGICCREDTHAKIASNLMEAKARQGTVLAAVRDDLDVPEAADMVLHVPALPEPLMPPVVMVSMQLLAYYIALYRGCPIDQPRNLAKSVTVE